MITAPDFEKKQIIFIFASEGERISLTNGNLIVKDSEGKVKIQVSCFRLFLVYVIGHLTITTPIIKEAQKYGFSFALFTTGFRYYSMVGNAKDGNTLLKKRQYLYSGIDIAKHITKNKIAMQYFNLSEQRAKSDAVKDAMIVLKQYYAGVKSAENRKEIMAYEGLASKIYFKNHFNNLLWQGRQPRIKKDWVNSTLDIGYTVLFSFIESLLSAYGFDTYVGVLHTQFYLRKSLVCDLVEPFRFLIDKTVKKCYNLKEIKEEDFTVINHQYQLKWENSPKYVRLFMNAILEEKMQIFLYIQRYYRCFMKQADISEYPIFNKGGILYGIDQL
ncbi:MAG: type V CRISPR-associated endonuclease Cas1 [Eubacteriales bacterium]